MGIRDLANPLAPYLDTFSRSGDDGAGASYVSPTAIVATGGNINGLEPGNGYKYHVYTSPGTFTVTDKGPDGAVEYLIIAGGGAGGARHGSGGGAGGLRTNVSGDPLAGAAMAVDTGGDYGVTVGNGGNPVGPGSSATSGNTGSPSSFNGIVSTGGGGGIQPDQGGPPNNGPGGSGGGGHEASYVGSGNTPPFSPPQGNPGGQGGQPTAGAGGAAHPITAFAAPLFPTMPTDWKTTVGPTGLYSPGGGGGSWQNPGGPAGGGGGGAGGAGQNGGPGPALGAPAGSGGAGNGGSGPSGAGGHGRDNTGGGGGGGGGTAVSGKGGTGIVIIRYAV